uniref:Endonuclease/exonuclease/phosphatase domain-containing protein n=1 Tax=Pundamilia nyererei TaxID=303518 RepID=A0A3B4HAY2_9CICH
MEGGLTCPYVYVINLSFSFIFIYVDLGASRETEKLTLGVYVVRHEGGICICAGDFNVILNYNLDTTSQTRCKTHISRHLNLTLEETGLVDVWRLLHPSQRDYTHYSIPHSVHTQIDYFQMQKEEFLQHENT